MRTLLHICRQCAQRAELRRPGHARQRTRLQRNPLRIEQLKEQSAHVRVAERIAAVDKRLHQPPHKPGRPADGQPVRDGAVVDAEVLHAQPIVCAGRHAQQHAAGVRRLREPAVHVVAEHLPQPERHATRAAAHAARQIDAQRVLRIHGNALRFQLIAQAQRRDGIAQKERLRVLVVHEVTGRVALRLPAPLRDRRAVIRRILDHAHALFPQHVLLPLPRVRGHVHRCGEAELCAHDADGQAEVARRADGHAVAGEQRTHRLRRKDGVVLPGREHAVRSRDVLGGFQHLIDAAARLDGAGDGQPAVELDHQPSGQRRVEPRLHPRDLHERRFQQSARGARLRKRLAEVRRKARKPRRRVLDVRHRQRARRTRLLDGPALRIWPERLLPAHEPCDDRVFRLPLRGGLSRDDAFHDPFLPV